MGKGTLGGTLPLQAPFLLQEKQPANQTMVISKFARELDYALRDHVLFIAIKIQGPSARKIQRKAKPRDDTHSDWLRVHSIIPQVKEMWA